MLGVVKSTRAMLLVSPFIILDQATKRVLLEGAVDGGLYKFHLIKNKASASPTPMVYRMLTRAVAQSLKHDRIFYLPWM